MGFPRSQNDQRARRSHDPAPLPREQAMALMSAVMLPMVDTKSIFSSTPSSRSRFSTPMWNAVARKPPPDSAVPGWASGRIWSAAQPSNKALQALR